MKKAELGMITLYTLPNCVQCEQTKKTLKKYVIDYQAISLKDDEEAYRFVTENLKHKSAPIIVVEDKDGMVIDHWSGFNPEKIETLYEIEGSEATC